MPARCRAGRTHGSLSASFGVLCPFMSLSAAWTLQCCRAPAEHIMNGRLWLWACQARRESTVEMWDSRGQSCIVGLSRGGLAEIKHADSAAPPGAFWVDGLEEETSEKADSLFVPACVCVFLVFADVWVTAARWCNYGFCFCFLPLEDRLWNGLTGNDLMWLPGLLWHDFPSFDVISLTHAHTLHVPAPVLVLVNMGSLQGYWIFPSVQRLSSSLCLKHSTPTLFH